MPPFSSTLQNILLQARFSCVPLAHSDSTQVLSRATMQQRLTAVRLYHDYLIEKQIRPDNPVGRGKYVMGKGVSTSQRGLLAPQHKLPWIPSDSEWLEVLRVLKGEKLRNQVMLLLAHDGALRRKELLDDTTPASATNCSPSQVPPGLSSSDKSTFSGWPGPTIRRNTCWRSAPGALRQHVFLKIFGGGGNIARMGKPCPFPLSHLTEPSSYCIKRTSIRFL